MVAWCYGAEGLWPLCQKEEGEKRKERQKGKEKEVDCEIFTVIFVDICMDQNSCAFLYCLYVFCICVFIFLYNVIYKDFKKNQMFQNADEVAADFKI
jgi:hypothetical protein